MFCSAAISTRLPTYFAAIVCSSSSLMNLDLSKTTFRSRKVAPPPGTLIAGARCGPTTDGPCCFGGAACCSKRWRWRSMSWLMTPGLTCGDVCARACATNKVTTAKPIVRGASRIDESTRPIAGRHCVNGLGGTILLPTIGDRRKVGTVAAIHRGSVDILPTPFTLRSGAKQTFDVHGRAVADDLDRTVRRLPVDHPLEIQGAHHGHVQSVVVAVAHVLQRVTDEARAGEAPATVVDNRR